MAIDRAQLLSSQGHATTAKDEFVRKYVEGHDDRAAGIGLNKEGSNWALKVFVEEHRSARGLPGSFHGLDVEVEVVGKVSARDRQR